MFLSPFSRQVGLMVFFCFLGNQVGGTILKPAWCWPLYLCPILYHDPLQQMDHVPVTNLTPADAHLRLPWSTWLLHLCPVIRISSLLHPSKSSLHFEVGKWECLFLNRGGWNADKPWEEEMSFYFSCTEVTRFTWPELNLKTKWIQQLFWPFVIYFNVNECVHSLLSSERGSAWRIWNPHILNLTKWLQIF